MNLSEMIFSGLGLLILLGIISFVVWKITRPKYLLFFLDPSGKAEIESIKHSILTKNRYFPWKSGLVDLKKHPEYIRFREIDGNREYLVEPWIRDKNLFLKEEETKVVYVKRIMSRFGIFLVHCLGTVESILTKETNNYLQGYKETELGIVSEDNTRRIIKSEDIFGIVIYEGIQN